MPQDSYSIPQSAQPLTVVEEVVPSADHASPARRTRCLRCQGRMLQAPDGDMVCFSCGNIVYSIPPLTNQDLHRHKASHAGWTLS